MKKKMREKARKLSGFLFRELSNEEQTETWRLCMAGYLFVNHQGIVVETI